MASAWDRLNDEQLMDLAKRTMAAAASETPGSIEWAMKWAGYDAVVYQLQKRLARHIGKELGLPDVDL